MLNKKIFSILLVCLSIFNLFAQAQTNPKKLITAVNAKFSKVKDYKAETHLHFEIPNVRMKDIDAKIAYKQPNKFKMKAKGVFFLPKQNPLQAVMTALGDTSAYQAVLSGTEVVAGQQCVIVSIIPLKDMNDLVLGKFWISEKQILVYKSELTTKNNGTVITENTFGNQAAYALPSAIKITMDVNKFKIPKMLALDINKKRKVENPADANKKEVANIFLTMKNYQINGVVTEADFVDEK
jgi:hypothetical protein